MGITQSVLIAYRGLHMLSLGLGNLQALSTTVQQ